MHPSNTTIEQALATYRETVSPSRASLHKILSHIPEQTNFNEGRARRSPYMWLFVTQAVTVCSILFALYPSLEESYIYRHDPFYTIDKEVAMFEEGIDTLDETSMMVNYINL